MPCRHRRLAPAATRAAWVGFDLIVDPVDRGIGFTTAACHAAALRALAARTHLAAAPAAPLHLQRTARKNTCLPLRAMPAHYRRAAARSAAAAARSAACVPPPLAWCRRRRTAPAPLPRMPPRLPPG
jgi:hypothetical protein